MMMCTFCSGELADQAITCRYCDELFPTADPGRYDVVLLYPGCRGLDVISAVSDLTGQSAASARRRVLACRMQPQAVLASLSLEDAEHVWASLKHLGATVEIVKSQLG